MPKLLNELPSNLLEAIASHLDIESSLLLAASSRAIRSALDREKYWLKRLYSKGFGVPKYRRNMRVKTHVIDLLNHCKTCPLCRAEWTSSGEHHLPLESSGSIEIIDDYSINCTDPPATFFDGIWDGPILTSEYINEQLGDDTLSSFSLHDHPVYESLLLTTASLFKLKCTLEWPYAPRQDDDDLPPEVIAFMPYRIATYPCPALRNRRGITIDDMLKTLKEGVLLHLWFNDGRDIECCEIREPGHLVIVIK